MSFKQKIRWNDPFAASLTGAALTGILGIFALTNRARVSPNELGITQAPCSLLPRLARQRGRQRRLLGGRAGHSSSLRGSPPLVDQARSQWLIAWHWRPRDTSIWH